MEQRFFHFAPQPMPDAKLVGDWEIKHCDSFQQALRISLNNALTPRQQEDWAEDLGYENPGTFSNVLNNDLTEKQHYLRHPKQTTGKKVKEFRKRYFDPNKIRDVIRLTGNLAIVQWLLKGTGYKVVKMTEAERIREIETEQKAAEVAALKARIAELEGQYQHVA